MVTTSLESGCYYLFVDNGWHEDRRPSQRGIIEFNRELTIQW